ncbi:hypothetical protein GCM10007857_54770 [Bradyrhizobium iriomotense]|uniref:Uncharacterized protein n=1 Tax=Bradyrhizobium iriomotense TaxID=441950 RepID=A0ABQ6B2U9_9BRAD|nr:hypothetical protein GCM10007857_54770 [Bradyrhizobium iriomotense]
MPAEALKQMRLPKIADVVVDAAALVPMRDQPDVAGQHGEKNNRETYFNGSHRAFTGRMPIRHEDKDQPPCTGNASASIAMLGEAGSGGNERAAIRRAAHAEIVVLGQT